MKNITRVFRMIRIQFVLMRYNVDEFIFAVPWLYPFRFLSYFNPWYWTSKNKLTRGERLRLALIELGPMFIKAGQILSTRTDLLPDDIAEEISQLQDRVPPFSGQIAKQMVEKALKIPLEEVFSEFDLTALASASIAQVHPAKLLDGREVVVKVLRPNIKKIMDRDLDLLGAFARLAERYWKGARHFKPQEIVEEISHTLTDELDLMREGANASQIRRNFLHSPYLYIPEVIWPYCRINVLVLERIEGIPIHNVAALRAAGMNMRKLAERGVEIFFKQVFRDSFFHADMHPGNIFVSKKNLDDPQYIAVDFGIVGSLSSKDQRYLAENMLAFIKRDYSRVAELHLASGWLNPSARMDQFEGALRAVCEPIFERPLKDISFGMLLLRIFQTAQSYNINIQPQLILLQKTLLNIEGVARQIYPDLDLWATAAPFLEKWLKQQIGWRAFFRRVRDNLPYWSEQLPDLPELIHGALVKIKEQPMEPRLGAQESVVLAPRMRRYFFFGLGLAFLISGSILLYSFTPLAWVLGGLGVLSLITSGLM